MISLRLEEFIDTKNLNKIADLFELLNQRELSVKNLGVHPRVITSWDAEKIVRLTRNGEAGKRKFSFVDFVWVKIVNDLRSFGIKLAVIQKIADEIYNPLPVKEVFDLASNHVDVLDGLQGESTQGFIDFIKSGEYKKVDYDSLIKDYNFNYIQVLVVQAIISRNAVSIIVFKDNEWFPYIKDNEHLYPKELLHKKEFSSQVRVNITELLFTFITEDFLAKYLNGLTLFTPQEKKLISYVKEGNYKKIVVLFKSKKQVPLEVVKSKKALREILEVLRENDYREFIVIDKKNKEFRIRDEAKR